MLEKNLSRKVGRSGGLKDGGGDSRKKKKLNIQERSSMKKVGDCCFVVVVVIVVVAFVVDAVMFVWSFNKTLRTSISFKKEGR